MSRFSLQNLILLVIVAGYLLVAGAYAVRVPDWQTPDEPAHYNYIAQMAEDDTIPVIEMGDWDQAYLDDLRAARFHPNLLGNLDRVQYEDHQPPLYYFLGAGVYSFSDGSLTALRVFSLLWGVIIVVAAYTVGLLMFPMRPWIGLGAAAFIAFLPQHVHILASVNNDSLAWALVAMTLAATTAYLRPDKQVTERKIPTWLLGLLVGLGFITKATTYFLAGVVPLAILLRWWIDTPTGERRARIGVLVRAWAGFLIPALLLGALWWGRNIDVYGWPDFLGLQAHDAVVVGQPRTAERINTIGFGAYLREISETTLNSFVGRFGWMGVPVTGWSYYVVLALMGVGLAGLGLVWTTTLGRRYQSNVPPLEVTTSDKARLHAVWLVLITTMLLSVLAYLYYNLEFQQYQGRYMYPLLIPLGILLALGIDAWRRALPVARGWPWLTIAPFLALAPLCVWLLWRVVVPNLEFVP